MPGTIWEQWGGDAHTPAGSKNHPMFCGGIGVFLYQLAGLHHEYDISSQHARIKLDRVAVERVGAASGSMRTPHGLLSWEWALRAGGSLSVELSIPHGFVTGELELPLFGHQTTLYEEGAGAVVWSRAGEQQQPAGMAAAALAVAPVGVRGVAARGTHGESPASNGHVELVLVVGLRAGEFNFVTR